MSDIAIIARAVCKSGKFETGQGTCAAICMGMLGDARKGGCSHAERVHQSLSTQISGALVLSRKSHEADRAFKEAGL